MNITELELNRSFEEIDNLVENNMIEEACEKYVDLAKKIQSNTNEISVNLKAEFYASFGRFLFNVSLYEEAINMFKEAQYYGYSKDEIKNILWKAFVEPNLNEFKSIYNENIKLLLSNGCVQAYVDFNDLPIWLIPTMNENEYYLYDKIEGQIKNKFSFEFEYEKTFLVQIVDEFSDYLIVEEWNWDKIYQYINNVNRENKKCYLVVKDIGRFFSYFQAGLIKSEILQNLTIFDGLKNMKNYFMESNAYVPRNIIDPTDSSKKIIQAIIEEIHSYRIDKCNRRGDNVLLSVCIPSYNRGKRAYDNIMHTLQSHYDEEIEIVISNNGTKNESKQYYNLISEIKDSRIKYFAFEENQGVAINICKVSELAKGKYILLLSDEDLINLKNLDKIMNMLKNPKENFSIIRAKGNGQAYNPYNGISKQGEAAMLTFMLTSNYLSGIIFNNDLLNKYKAAEYVKNNLDNTSIFYYPHMYFELLLCQYGDVRGTDIVLINEGKEEVTEVERKEIGFNNKVEIPQYATLDGRLEQHKGFLQIIRALEICKKDYGLFRKMYIKLSIKTMTLILISIDVFYKNTDADLAEIIDKTYEICVEYLDNIYQSLNIIQEYYVDDLEKIKNYYNYIKNIIDKNYSINKN